MDPFLFRIVRSFALAAIMFFSLRGLCLNGSAALIGSLVPLLLGVVDVMAGTAFGLTGLIFIIAVVAHIFPQEAATIGKVVQDSVHDSNVSLVQSNQPTDSTKTNVAEKK